MRKVKGLPEGTGKNLYCFSSLTPTNCCVPLTLRKSLPKCKAERYNIIPLYRFVREKLGFVVVLYLKSIDI